MGPYIPGVALALLSLNNIRGPSVLGVAFERTAAYGPLDIDRDNFEALYVAWERDRRHLPSTT